MAKKVLIIDDEQDMRVYLEALFRKAGYETETASDGEEGVRLAEAHRPDLITLDVLMPRKWGSRPIEAAGTPKKRRRSRSSC